jgi:L-fuculose-phosphate aldolase
MHALSHSETREAIVRACDLILKTGAISMSNHGNFSARVPGTDRLIFTGSPSLANVTPESLCVVGLDGQLIEGEINPTSLEIINMHIVVYRGSPTTGAVVHTHAPFISAFALAGLELECSYEAMVRAGITESVPFAAYAPRGSDESVGNIAAVMPRVSKPLGAVILGNHGLLAFGPDALGAARANNVVEEAAQIATYAAPLGGAKPIAPHMRTATIERRDAFAAQGARRV